MLVAVGHRLVALLSIADPLKPEAASVVAALRNLGVACCMLTGDNKRTAQAVASQLRVDAVFAEVLPAEKAQVGDPHLGGGVEEMYTGVKETYIQGMVLLPADSGGSGGEASLAWRCHLQVCSQGHQTGSQIRAHRPNLS